MLTYMLGRVIEDAFDKFVGTWQLKRENRCAMHIGFAMSHEESKQHDVNHMWLYGAANYVSVVTQNESIKANGDREVGEMELLCHHDSCWRDTIKTWLFKNRNKLNAFSAFSLFDWFDVVELKPEEIEYLEKLPKWNYDFPLEDRSVLPEKPFDKRGIWGDRSCLKAKHYCA